MMVVVHADQIGLTSCWFSKEGLAVADIVNVLHVDGVLVQGTMHRVEGRRVRAIIIAVVERVQRRRIMHHDARNVGAKLASSSES